MPRPGAGRLAYTVTAVHPTEESAARYVAWLVGGHVQAVIAGGAESATIIRQSEPQALAVEVRYGFPSRAAFDRYVREVAPGLRAEGLALFGPGTGVVISRSVGDIAEQFGPVGS